MPQDTLVKCSWTCKKRKHFSTSSDVRCVQDLHTAISLTCVQQFSSEFKKCACYFILLENSPSSVPDNQKSHLTRHEFEAVNQMLSPIWMGHFILEENTVKCGAVADLTSKWNHNTRVSARRVDYVLVWLSEMIHSLWFLTSLPALQLTVLQEAAGRGSGRVWCLDVFSFHWTPAAVWRPSHDSPVFSGADEITALTGQDQQLALACFIPIAWSSPSTCSTSHYKGFGSLMYHVAQQTHIFVMIS